MSSAWSKVKYVVLRVVGNAISGPGFLANAVKTATVSVASTLAEMLQLGVADDLRQLKNDGLRRSRAKTDAEEAKAREVLARAIEAENRATLLKRNDRISKAQEALTRAEAAKKEAEAKAVLAKAEGDRAKAQAEAVVQLIEAAAKLKQNGGCFAVDPENLSRILLLDHPPLPSGETTVPPKEKPGA
jgi:hypothetical protein